MMETMILPLSILAFAFVLHGFPDIRIGTKETNIYKNCHAEEGEEDIAE